MHFSYFLVILGKGEGYDFTLIASTTGGLFTLLTIPYGTEILGPEIDSGDQRKV